MTATAPLLDPPATPDAELAPLLDDRERACEVYESPDEPCGRPAAWAVSLAGPCRCNDMPDAQMEVWCDPHVRDARRLGACCADCCEDIRITWIEAL